MLLSLSSPPHSLSSQPRPISPSSSTGWTDIPSDDEETHTPLDEPAISVEERRREIANNREERLRAIRARDGDADEGAEMWGGSDEEVGKIF